MHRGWDGTTYGVAIIGMGKISENHINGWKKLSDAEIKVLVDVDASRASEKAKRFNVPRHDTNYQNVLNASDVDIVDICLPHDLHAPYSIQAMEAGKHVLVEKPIATKLSDAERMIDTSRKTGKKLMVAESMRYDELYLRVEKLLNSKAIGDPFFFSTRCEFFVDTATRFQGPHTGWRSVPEKIGGGVLLESGIHNIALARYLMGEVDTVYALKGKQTRLEIPVEDTLSLLLSFKSGATGQGSFSWGMKWSKPIIESTIYGTGGVLNMSVMNRNGFLESTTGREEWSDQTGEYGHGNEIKHFLDCIKEDRTPITDGVAETKTLKLIMAAYESVKRKAPVSPDELAS